MFDLAAIGFLIGQGIGRWGNFVNQEAYGAFTGSKWWGMQSTRTVMEMGEGLVHPCFLYESIWNVVGFVGLILVRRLYKNLKTGQLTGMYLIWYSVGRIFIEGMRTDSLMLGNIKVAQLVSLLFIVAGVLLIIFKGKSRTKIKLYREGEANEIRF